MVIGMKKYILFPLIFLILSCAENEKLPVIGIVQLMENDALDMGRLGVIETLKDSGLIHGKNIEIDYRNAQGDLANVFLILKQMISKNVNIIVTVSTPCMLAVANMKTDIPVVYTVSFSPEQMGISNPDSKISGVFDPYDIESLVNIILAVQPDLKAIGIPWNSSEQNAEMGVKKLKRICDSLGIHFYERQVNSTSEVYQSIQSLLTEEIDCIVICADNTLCTAMETVSHLALNKKIPVYVTEPDFVKKGALLGLGLDYYQWGKESGKMAAELLKGKDIEEKSSKEAEKKMLYINRGLADSLKIMIPDSILNQADSVFY